MNLHEYAQYLAMEGEAEPSVTVEPLEVTENGEYSEEGKAYSPVTVNVANTTEFTELTFVNSSGYAVTMYGLESIDDGNRTAVYSKSISFGTTSTSNTKTVKMQRYGKTVAFTQPYGCLFEAIILVKNKDTATFTATEGTLKYARCSTFDNSNFRAYVIQLNAYNATAPITITIA